MVRGFFYKKTATILGRFCNLRLTYLSILIRKRCHCERAKRVKQSAKFQQTLALFFPQKFKVCKHLKDKLSAGTGQIASLRSASLLMNKPVLSDRVILNHPITIGPFITSFIKSLLGCYSLAMTASFWKREKWLSYFYSVLKYPLCP